MDGKFYSVIEFGTYNFLGQHNLFTNMGFKMNTEGLVETRKFSKFKLGPDILFDPKSDTLGSLAEETLAALTQPTGTALVSPGCFSGQH